MSLISQSSVHSRLLRLKLVPLVAGVMLCWGPGLGAQPDANAKATRIAQAALLSPSVGAADASSYSLTFKQLGREKPFNLRGVDGRFNIPFSVRADEVVTRATLKLTYTYSPDMLSELSKINILINGEVAASLPLPKEASGRPVTSQIELPAHMITEFNQLTLQLIGHYTTACEDPQHSSLWATISNQGVLALSTAQAPLANDLALLPQPFFDHRDGRKLSLPVVFQGVPDNATLEAAGTLASWFGLRANSRVLSFPVSVDALPAKGNAIVLLGGKARLPGLLLSSQGDPTGPSLAVVVNPNDPNGKLLLVQGRDGQELKVAATTLATAAKTLVGQSMAITQAPQLHPRKAYDAPNWLRSDRPVKFAELSSPQTLNVTGYDPGDISIGVRLPPDLFRVGDKGVPLALKYRYTPQPTSVNSSMTIFVNETYLKSLPLLPMERLSGAPLLAKLEADETLSMQAKAHIRLSMLQPKSVINLRYMYDYVKQGECRDVIIDNVRGAIDPDSTLDISGHSHHMAMPNLAAYGISGYPFSRMADLSHTAVVLADTPHAGELSTYLSLLGRIGEATGYPATAVTVARSAGMTELADKDLLMIATGANQPLLKSWAHVLPPALDDSRRAGLLETTGQLGKLLAWLTAVLPDALMPAAFAGLSSTAATVPFSSDGLSAYAAGFESPLRSGRSVVLFWGPEPAALQAGVDALLGEDGEPAKLAGSLAILRGNKVDTLADETTYHVSDLDRLTRTRLALSENIGPLLLLAALSVALCAVLTLSLLRTQARKRRTN